MHLARCLERSGGASAGVALTIETKDSDARQERDLARAPPPLKTAAPETKKRTLQEFAAAVPQGARAGRLERPQAARRRQTSR